MFIKEALAAEHTDAANAFVGKFQQIILFPLMGLLLSLALLVFIWGAFEFVRNADSDEGRNTGKRHMLFGIIGMLIMVSALAILKIAAGTFGLTVTP